MDGPLLWGYFFVGSDAAKMLRLAARLVEDGYSLVVLGRRDVGKYQLHLERAEAHSAESLYERNEVLRGLAVEFGVESYDGMDVGPVAA